ncbi:fascin domain-containing protein [Actinophytocola sediminis]
MSITTALRRVTSLIALAAALATGAVVGASTAVAEDPGCRVVSIRNQHSGTYVSAEFSWTGSNNGILRARANSVGPWERFELCLSDGIHTIRSLHNGLYVSAEYSWTGDNHGILRARADTVGKWERFHLNGNLLSSAHTKMYVSAEFSWTGDSHGILRARAATPGPWERFTVERTP